MNNLVPTLVRSTILISAAVLATRDEAKVAAQCGTCNWSGSGGYSCSAPAYYEWCEAIHPQYGCVLGPEGCGSC